MCVCVCVCVVGVGLHSFVSLTLDEGEWLTSRPGHFTSSGSTK